MSAAAVSAKVLSGPYAGATRAQIKTAHEAALASLLAYQSARLSGSSVNGQSFQADPAYEAKLKNRIRDLQIARAQVDPDFLAPSSQIAVRF